MIRTALGNPHLVVVVALAVVVLGGYSYTKIPVDLLPQFETSAVQIVTFYPGMPPEVMEKDIMSRLQRWTGQSVGIEHQEAKAMQGVCIVKDFFRDGISMDTAMSQVTSYAMSDMFYLPPGTIPPMVMPFDPTGSVPLCLVVVSNEQMDEQELYDIAYFELRNKLQAIQGVIAPAVYGGKLRRILAYLDREKLEAHGLSLMDVQKALLQQNVLVHVRTLFTVHLNGDEMFVQDGGHLFVLERLAFHHVTPVTSRITDRQKDALAFCSGFLEGFLPSRVPVHGIVGMLQQVRAGFVNEGVCVLV